VNKRSNSKPSSVRRAYAVGVAVFALAVASSSSFGHGGEELLIPPSPFAEALSTPDSSSVVDIPPLSEDAIGGSATGDTIPLSSGSFCRCPQCRAGRNGAYPSGTCLRGTDHLGSLFHDRLGDCRLIESAATGSVLAYHGTMDYAARVDRRFCESTAGNWVDAQGHVPCPLCCKLQCKFVNWRHSSMYLCGCMPEGYALSRFIASVPQADFHDAPLFAGGPVEPTLPPTLGSAGSRSITQVSLDITPPPGALPGAKLAGSPDADDVRVHLPGTHRDWCGTTYYWQASLLNHQPLYFEDVNLERNGYSYGPIMQPVVSGAKFFATLPALPYLMTAQPPHTARYTLGESRPGSPAPYVHEFPPLNFDAAAVEAATVTGLIFLIP